MRIKRSSPNASMHLERLEGRQLMAAGDLDTTFGVGGKVIAQAIGFEPADIAVQNDGKIVAVGELNGDFAIARLNADGTLDRPFGGKNRPDRGMTLVNFNGNRGDFATSVAIQSDGKIVVAGRRDHHSNADFGDQGHFAIARLNADGSLDKSFDDDGRQTIDFKGFGQQQANALAIQPDGRILVLGTSDTHGVSDLGANRNDFAIARLMPNGSLDNSFGDRRAGIGASNTRTGKTTIDFGSDSEQGSAISLTPDGKIVVAGPRTNSIVAVARLNANGTRDGSFEKDHVTVGPGMGLGDVTVAPDGSVFLVGGLSGNFAVTKLKPNGSRDNSFGQQGFVSADFGGTDEARHVRVTREGVLVAGRSGGNFALARFRQNGLLDGTFGQGGKVTTSVGPGQAILTTTLTNDGKITAYGRNGGSARYILAVPKVNVFSLDPFGSEAGINNASLIFTRDLRASFPTRVVFDLAGTATLGADYTGPFSTQVIGSSRFVDIPAGETTVVVPITVFNDTRLEAAETVLASIRADSAYALGNRTTQKVDIADDDIVRVNFQATPSPFAFAYEPDLGLTFGARNRGLQFGWDVDNRANARARRSSGRRLIYDTFNHMQKSGGGSKWEIAVPNGTYQVKLAAGDPEQIDSVHSMNLENVPALQGTPGGNVRWFERTVNVLVTDGRLTLTNGAGAVNNKVAFIEVRAAAPGTVAGPVTANVPVRLPRILPRLQPGGTISP